MWIDIIFLIFAAYGFYLGFSKGILKTVFTVIAFVIGLMIAVRFSDYLESFLENAFNTEGPVIFLTSFFLTFLLTMAVIRGLAKAIERFLEKIKINFINKAIGGLILAGLFTLLYSGLVWFGDRAGIITDDVRQESQTYPYLQAFPGHVRTFVDKVSPTVNKFRDKSVETLDELEKGIKEKKQADDTSNE